MKKRNRKDEYATSSVARKINGLFVRVAQTLANDGWEELLRKAKRKVFPRNLTDFACKYKTDKEFFTYIYDFFFKDLRNQRVRLLEIGILDGASLKMWEKYFPHAQIYGIDICDKSYLNSKRIKTFIANQEKRGDLQKVLDECGKSFDIIIDDGGHTMKQQQISFGFLFRHVRPGGYYISEDLHTSRPDFFPRYSDSSTDTPSLDVILNYIKKDKLNSPYMSNEEMHYIQSHIEFINLFSRTDRYNNIACVVKKKGA